MHQIETTDDEFESMKYVQLPDNRVRALSFYLAMEEYVARHVDESVCFFMWQVKPSVIFGRNQFFENEVNIDYCRQHNIEVFRRTGEILGLGLANYASLINPEAIIFTGGISRAGKWLLEPAKSFTGPCSMTPIWNT